MLDEATASIDTDTETLIQASVRNVSSGRTTIIIAHRLSTIRHCDCIYVLRSGRIREQGSHEALMALGGIYRKLHDMQIKDS